MVWAQPEDSDEKQEGENTLGFYNPNQQETATQQTWHRCCWQNEQDMPYIIDVACQGDSRITMKEEEKVNKYDEAKG